MGVGMSIVQTQPPEEPGCGKGAKETQLNAGNSGESKDHESETADKAGTLHLHS